MHLGFHSAGSPSLALTQVVYIIQFASMERRQAKSNGPLPGANRHQDVRGLRIAAQVEAVHFLVLLLAPCMQNSGSKPPSLLREESEMQSRGVSPVGTGDEASEKTPKTAVSAGPGADPSVPQPFERHWPSGWLVPGENAHRGAIQRGQ